MKIPGCDCANCPLVQGQLCNSSAGNPSADLILIGEGPSQGDAIHGVYFSGSVGRFSRAYVEYGGIPWSKVHLDHIVACVADKPLTESQRLKAAKACAPRLQTRISQIQPTAPIVALGKHAVTATTGVHRVNSIFGSVVQSIPSLGARQVLASLSPSVAFRKGNRAQLPLIGAFLIRSAKLAQGQLKSFKWPTIYTQPGGDALAALRRIKRSGLPVALDIEDYGDDNNSTLMAIGLGTTEEVVSMPWDAYDSKKYGPVSGLRQREYGAAIEDEILGILAECSITAHNGSYDVLRLRNHGILVCRFEFDTLVAHSLVAPELGHDLHSVSVAELNTEPWKHDFKAGAEDKGALQFVARPEYSLREYNARDVAATAAIALALGIRLEVANLSGAFVTLMELTRISMEMQYDGVNTSNSRLKELKTTLASKLGRLHEELAVATRTLGQQDFNPDSSRDTGALYQGRLEVQPVKYTELGQSSWDEEALSALQKHDNPVVRQLAKTQLEYRKIRKLLRDHVELLPRDKDGLVHPKWKPWGPVTGRWSCNRPNLMNVPKGVVKVDKAGVKHEIYPSLRDIYVPRHGNYMVKADKSQLELRINAQLTGDQALIEAYKNGVDVHAQNARDLFSLTREATKNERTFAKNFVFNACYEGSPDVIHSLLLPEYPTTSLREVAALLQNWNSSHPRIHEAHLEWLEFVKANDYIEIPLSGRRRYFYWHPEITEIANTPVQGMGAAMMNQAVLDIWPQLRRDKGEYLLIQCHDELVLEGPDPERLVGLLNSYMDQTYTLNGITMRYPIDISVGPNWKDCKPWKT